jgi:hypothetical protein
MGWVAAVGLAVGCATGGQQTRQSETVSAQSQAERSFQAAADAQKRATDEQRRAEQAHQDVIAAQKALADAQARARSQQARADQAQAEAQQLAAAANQQGVLSQQQAQQNMQTETAEHQRTVEQNQSWQNAQEARGTVISAGNDNVALRTDDQQTLQLGVSGSTAVILDGRQASAQQLLPGTEVRASYQTVDGHAQALRIRARSSSNQQPQ